MKILIVVPAVNEETTVEQVIKDLKKHGYKKIVLIDDGSTDQTAPIAKKNKVTVISHLINRGLGAGLGTGFEYGKKNNYDYLVTFDADGQHLASDIKRLVEPLINGSADVVIGSRMLNSENMPTDRKILNYLSNLLTTILYGISSSDSLSGLRAFNKKAIWAINIKTDRMEVSNEFFREIKRNSLRMKEIPIEPIYTEYSRESGQRNSNAFSVVIKMLIRLFR